MILGGEIRHQNKKHLNTIENYFNVLLSIFGT